MREFGPSGGPAKGDELTKIEQRRAQVAHLLTIHHTYREMAQQLGVSHSTIGEDVKVIRERWRERASTDYADFLAEELATLDNLERDVLPQAVSGGPKGSVNLWAVDRVFCITRHVLAGTATPIRKDARASFRHTTAPALAAGLLEELIGGGEPENLAGRRCLEAVGLRVSSEPDGEGMR